MFPPPQKKPGLLFYLPVKFPLGANAGNSSTAENKHTVVHGTVGERGGATITSTAYVEFEGSAVVGTGGENRVYL